MGASADATSRGSSAGNAAHLGLDLLTPLALALGAAEVETRAKAATRVRDLAREGRVSCAAAAKSGAVAALVALATHFADASFLRGGAVAETDRSATGSAPGFAPRNASPRNETRRAVWACARDAADALTALALMDRGEGTRTLAASARTVAATLAAVAATKYSYGDDDDDDDDDDVRQVSEASEARRAVTRLVFALAGTTPVRIALAADRNALSALARDAGSRDAALAAAAAGVLWVAATPPETLGDAGVEGARASKVTEHVTEHGAVAAAGDVADALARRHLPLLAEAMATARGVADDDGTPSVDASREKRAGDQSDQSSLARRRVALAVASIAGRDAARAVAVSRERRLMECLVRRVGEGQAPAEERRAAATALWRVVSGVLSRRLASAAAKSAVIDALVAETRLVFVLAQALLVGSENAELFSEPGEIARDDSAPERESNAKRQKEKAKDARAGDVALARLAAATLGALSACASFAVRIAEPNMKRVNATDTRQTANTTPLDAILAFAVDSVGTSSSAWALWCAREAASASPRLAARCAARPGLAPALARAAAAGGDAGAFAAGLAWLCLTAAEEGGDGSGGVTEKNEKEGAPTGDSEKETASRQRAVSAFAHALAWTSVPSSGLGSGSGTEAGANLAATLRSMTARCVALDAEAVSTSDSALGDSTPCHARGVSFASAESVRAGPASAGGGGGAAARDSLARRYHLRRRSRAASGELGFWGSQDLDVPGDFFGSAAVPVSGMERFANQSGPRSAGFQGSRETPRSSLGTLANRFSHGSSGATSLGWNRDPSFRPRHRLGPESRLLAAAIVSATVRAFERDEDPASAEALLLGGLPELLVGLVCDGDGDDDLGPRFADSERPLDGSSFGAGADEDANGDSRVSNGTAFSFLRGFGVVPRTIHACAAPGLGSFLRLAGRGSAVALGETSQYDSRAPRAAAEKLQTKYRRALAVLTEPGEGLLLAAAATLASRDAAAAAEVAESLADVLVAGGGAESRREEKPQSRSGTASARTADAATADVANRNVSKRLETELDSRLAAAVAGQPGVLDGLARAVKRAATGLEDTSAANGSAGDRYGAYGDSLPGGLASYNADASPRRYGYLVSGVADAAPGSASGPALREGPDHDPGAPMITVPLPATPKGGDGAEKDALPESNSSRTESALARLILPPARAAGDDDDDDDRSFLSMDSPSPRPPSLRDLEPPPPRSGDAATAATAERYRRARVSVPTSSLGPAPSPRAASARRRAGSWLGAASGGVGSAGPGSPRGHERAWSVSGLGSALRPRASLKGGGSRDEARLSGDFFWRERRGARRVTSSRAARRAAATAALRAVSALVLADVSGKIAARTADDAEMLRAVAEVFDSVFGRAETRGTRTGDERECFAFDARDFQPGGVGVLLGAAARAVASLARRGERDRAAEAALFGRGEAADILQTNYSSACVVDGDGPGSFASAATALVFAEPASPETARARRAEKTLDALLRVAVAASSLGATVPNAKASKAPSDLKGNGGSEALEASVAAAEAMACLATHPRVAAAMAAHGKVVPQLLALTAPPHAAAVAAAAADALAAALVAQPPAPGSAAAETVWSVDAVEVLVRACRRGIGAGKGGSEASGAAEAAAGAAAEAAAAAAARALAVAAMTAEDDASRADIADEPGVLGTVAALLRPPPIASPPGVKRADGCRGGGDGRDRHEENSRGLVLAGACRLLAELARTPAALAAARADASSANLEGAPILGGALRALASDAEKKEKTRGDVTSAAAVANGPFAEEEEAFASDTEDMSRDVPETDACVALGSWNARVASMCALSRLAAADVSIAAALAKTPSFVSAAARAIAAAAAASRAEGGGGGGGGGAAVLTKDTASDTFWLASHAACALTACAAGHFRDGYVVSKNPAEAAVPEPSARAERATAFAPFRAAVFSPSLFRNLAELVAGPETSIETAPPNEQTGAEEFGDRSVPSRSEVSRAPAPCPPKGAGPPPAPVRANSQAPTTLRARRGAGALAALAVGDAAAPAGRQSRREPPSRGGARAAHLRAHLAARLGASRLLRVVVSGPGAGENPEDSRLTAASAQAFLRAMLMLRFDRGLGGTKNDRTRDGFRNEDAVHARACSLVVRAAAEGLRDCARVDGAGVASVVAGEDILAATGTPNAATALAATAGRIETTQTPSPSQNDALAAAAALAVVVDVATRRPEWVAALSRASGVVRALAGFLDRESFVRAREAANEPLRATVQDSKEFADVHDTTTVVMHETRIFHDDTALPPPFAYPFEPVQTAYTFERDDDDVDDASETETDSERKTKTSLYLAEGGFANARLVAADVFAAIAAVAPARVVAADSRAARALVEMVAESRVRRAAATAAARALWSLGLAEGDGAAAVDATPGAVAALAGMLAETASAAASSMSSMDESTLSTDLAAETARAAAAGALGAVFSGAAGSRDPRRFRCACVAFDVQGAARGLADVMRGSDGDGAVAAAAALAAATRMPAGAARVAEDEAPLSALCAVAAGGTSKERFEISFGDEENAGTETAAAAHAADALANLAAHASSAKILAASPTALSAWLEAVTRLCASRRPETRAASVGAARAFATRGRFIFQNTDARVVAALVAAIAERLSDPREVLSTRVGAAGCASALALARVVAETPGESAFVDALVAALRFVGEASASASARGDPSATRAQLRQLARLAATATKTLCACPRNTNGGIMRTSVAADLARAAEEAAGSWRGGGADPATAAAVAETLAFLARRAKRSSARDERRESRRDDGTETSRRRLAEAVAASAGALVAAVVAGTAETKYPYLHGSADDPTASTSPGSPGRPARNAFRPGRTGSERRETGSERDERDERDGSSRTTRALAVSAIDAIAALADAGETFVAPFLEDGSTRRDALAAALAAGAARPNADARRRSVPESKKRATRGVVCEGDQTRDTSDTSEEAHALASSRALRALAGVNEAWAAVVAAHAFDALIHRLRWMHFRDGYLVSENNARAARRDDVVRKTPLENADADAVRVKHDQHESVVFHAPNIPNIRLMRLTGRDARSAEALAASALRRCLDFGALDESQALALAAPGAGLLEGALECIVASFCFREPSFLQSARDDKKGRFSRAAVSLRFALDGASHEDPARAFDDDDVSEIDADDTKDAKDAKEDFVEISAETALCAAIRAVAALASTSGTTARAVASAVLSYSYSVSVSVSSSAEKVSREEEAEAGDGFPRFRVTEPIAALAAVAREAASRDATPLDAPSDGARTPLAMAVCEAVAILAGASRAARRAFVREEGVVAAFQSMARGAVPPVAAAAAAAAASLGAR